MNPLPGADGTAEPTVAERLRKRHEYNLLGQLGKPPTKRRPVTIAGGIRPSGKKSWMKGRTFADSDREELASAHLSTPHLIRNQSDGMTMAGRMAERARIAAIPRTVLPDGVADGAETMATLGYNRKTYGSTRGRAKSTASRIVQPGRAVNLGAEASFLARARALGLEL